MRRGWLMWAAAIAAVLALSLAATPTPAHDPGAEARYLANEAVLVSHGAHKVLFDAFYSQSFGTLALVPKPILDALMAGTPPYDAIDAVFVSHIHGDHFSAGPMLDYLRAQPDVRLYGPSEVVDALATAAGSYEDPVLERVVPFDLRPGDAPRAASLGAIEIDAVAVPHAGSFKSVRNLVFRVRLGAWPTVMHLGDAGPDDTAFAPQQTHWDAHVTHTAFPPYFFVGDDVGKAILARRIRPRQIIAIHIPVDAAGQGAAWRARLGVDAFTDPGESRAITHGE